MDLYTFLKLKFLFPGYVNLLVCIRFLQVRDFTVIFTVNKAKLIIRILRVKSH